MKEMRVLMDRRFIVAMVLALILGVTGCGSAQQDEKIRGKGIIETTGSSNNGVDTQLDASSQGDEAAQKSTVHTWRGVTIRDVTTEYPVALTPPQNIEADRFSYEKLESNNADTIYRTQYFKDDMLITGLMANDEEALESVQPVLVNAEKDETIHIEELGIDGQLTKGYNIDNNSEYTQIKWHDDDTDTSYMVSTDSDSSIETMTGIINEMLSTSNDENEVADSSGKKVIPITTVNDETKEAVPATIDGEEVIGYVYLNDENGGRYLVAAEHVNDYGEAKTASVYNYVGEAATVAGRLSTSVEGSIEDKDYIRYEDGVIYNCDTDNYRDYILKNGFLIERTSICTETDEDGITRVFKYTMSTENDYDRVSVECDRTELEQMLHNAATKPTLKFITP